MRVLVLGATGSIGVHTSLYLKSLGYDVIASGRRNSDNGFFADYDISYCPIDITKRDSFKRIRENIDVVVHFAGAMPARMKGYNPYEYIDTIVLGTLNVLEFVRERGIPKIVFSQSIADVLYRFGETTPIEDDAERRFPLNSDHSVYSISKNAAVNLIEHYHAKYDINRFILRLPTIYVYHPNPYYYVNGVKQWMGYRYIIEQAMKGNTLEIWGNPNSIKEMVYIKDFIRLVGCCVNNNGKGGVYNASCGCPISIEEQIRSIAEVFCTSQKSPIVYRPEKPSSPQFVLSIDKAKRELGYSPMFGFKDLLIDFKEEMIKEPFSRLWGKREDYIHF